MSKIRQKASVRNNYDVDTEDDNLEDLTEEQIAEFNKIVGDDDCNPFKTFATYEEFEKDLIRHIEIGRKEIENGNYCTFEEFKEEIKGWMRSK